ncbi:MULTISPECIES: hypothetical protein [Streptosporangium]|uniref:S-DNA-T family DNA segregation ATPase FtsK/SpoIIIE n=1 Tax=Streptosporangium brasiliense TaxID=47480 RepID=A0ABT9R463_9ACTN|nr:hypothetical protein [Streptosporangium brasiliense]MDP9864027.1 S-DNA-T family DNA segregation ATPase FtsK/SpoIIIE [Streptosporangium brasiliense]
MGTTTTPTPRPDWSLTPRGTVSATAQGALALAALASIGDLTGLNPIWGGAATAAGALGTVVVSAHHDHGPASLLYRLGCWLGAGAWWTYTLATTPWNLNTFAALGIGALTAGLLAPLGRHTPRAPRRPGTALVLRHTSRIGAEWEARIQRVCRLRVTVTDVTMWATRTGYDVHLDLPGAGSTLAQISGAADALATDARLPEGCGVEVGPGMHRAAVVLRVSTVNRLEEEVPFPPLTTSASITDPVEIGEYRNGDVVQVPMRQASALVIGQTGSGKTILLNVLTSGVARCRDALVWHIDLNGGSLSQMWLAPWLDGRTDRPAVDWAASTPAEALDMALAALRIAKDRKTSARKLKIAADTTLMPVSPDLPEIVIFLDEGAEAVSPGDRSVRELREALEEIQRIGRDSAVRIVASSLRSTSDVLPPMIKKMSHVRIAMYVQDQSELGLMYEHNRAVNVADLPGPGCGFVQIGQATPRPFKGQYMLPSTVISAAVQIAAVRPELDERAQRFAGRAYADRYERMHAAFTDHDTDDAEGYERAIPAAPVAPARHLTVLPGGGGAEAWADPFDLARHRPAAPAPTSAAAWPEPRRPILRAEQIHPVNPAPQTRPVPPIMARALAAFAAADAERLHSAELADALGLSQTELADALRPYGIAPLEQPFKRSGTRARGYALEDFRVIAGGHTPGSQARVTPGHSAL